MVSTGVVRQIDQLGRVVLPMELRRVLGINSKESFEFYTDGHRVILKKYQPACIFCNSFDGIKQLNGKNVCRTCIEAMRK